eukprot:8490775-Prorocentrum_lima.AAC.1
MRVSPGVELFLVLIKRWAKQRNLCDASMGNLSAYGHVVLALIFLRHFGRGPWIPDLFPDRLFPIDATDSSVTASVSQDEARGTAEKEGRVLVDGIDA